MSSVWVDDIPDGAVIPEEGNPPSWTFPIVRDVDTSIRPSSLVPAEASRSIVAIVSTPEATIRTRLAAPTDEVTCVTGIETVVVPAARTCEQPRP